MSESSVAQPSPKNPAAPIVLPAQVVEGGLVFGRYRLARELGRGGFGVVWLARDEELGLEVALKFLPDLVSRDAEAVDDLKREIRRGLRLSHPGIVRVHNFIRDEQMAAISMDFVDGITLRQRKLESPGRCVDTEQLVPLVGQLCDVLSYVHEVAKLVHRDIKPGNLMVSTWGEVKVADFGIAGSLADSLTRMTNTPASGGTIAYMSPQQARGEAPQVTDDIYALGATFFELLTGKPPFYRGDIALQASEIVPPSMTQRREELGATEKDPIPPEWENAVAMCLSKTSEGRPQSMRALRDMLLTPATVVGGHATHVPAAKTPPPALPGEAPKTTPTPAPAPSQAEQKAPATPPPAPPAFSPTPSFPPTFAPPPSSLPIVPIVIAGLAIVITCGWLGWKLADTGASPGKTAQPPAETQGR